MRRLWRFVLAVSIALPLWTGTLPAYGAVLDAGTAFTRVFTAQDNGAIAIFGNSLMSCSSAQSGCAQARTGAGSKLNNNDWSMTWVDTDGDPSTQSSSSSDVVLPAGATVLWAGMYWGGDRAASGDTAARTVRLRAPGGSYQAITAQRFLSLQSGRGAYHAFADVTAAVRAGGTGTWWGADAVSQLAADKYAGWSLVVAFRDPAQPLRDLTVFDGFTQITTSAQQTLTISGFLTPPSGPVRTQLGVVAYEGDLGLTGDQMKLNNIPLQDQVIRSDNFFDSGNTALGRLNTGRNPADRNMLGYDLKVLQADGILANGSTSASIGLTTRGDVYYPGVVTTAIDLYSPQFPGDTKSVVNLNGNNPAQPGDTLQYTVVYTNTGQDSATDAVVTDPLPPGVTYIPGSLVVTAGANLGPKTDATGDDQGEYNSAARTVRMRIGTGATAALGGTLAPKATTTFTFRVAIDRAAGGTTLTNATTLDYRAKTIGLPYSATGFQVVTPVARSADLALAKTVSPNPASAGGQLVYILTVSNHGPSSADNAVITETLPAGTTFVSAEPVGLCSVAGQTVTCRLGTMADGAQTTVRLTVDVAAGQAIGPLTNVATVASDTPDPNLANNTTGTTGAITAAADLSLRKDSSPATAVRGEQVTYTLTATNAGPSDAAAATITETLPPGTTLVSMPPSCSMAGTVITCPVGVIAKGGNRSVTIVITLEAGRAGSTLDNTASVTSATPDPDTGNNNATRSLPVQSSADLTIAKEASPSSFTAGTAGRYLIRVTNNGPSDAEGVVVTDPLTAGLTLVDASTDHGPCDVIRGPVQCGLGTIGVGVTVLVSVNVTVAANVTGTLANTSTVTSTTPDPSPGNETATATTPVTAIADLAITKSAQPVQPIPGQPVTYTLTITNNGPSDSAGVVAADTLPPTLTATSVTASQGTCVLATVRCTLGTVPNGATATVTIVADIPSGTTGDLADVGTVTSPTTDPVPGNNTATFTSSSAGQADLAITKVAAPASIVAGENITYTLTAVNHGPSDAQNVTVTDPLGTGLTLVSAAGAGISCTATVPVTCALGNMTSGTTHTITIVAKVSASVTAPTVTNTASIAGLSPADPTLSNNEASSVTPVTTQADMGITKSGAPATVVAGEAITYTLTVTNRGPSDAQNVTVFDPLPDEIEYLSATVPGGSCVGLNGRVNCDVGLVTAGGTAIVTIQGRVLASAPAATLTNTANVNTSTQDPNGADDQASTPTTVTTSTQLSITKSVSPSPIVAGRRAVYTLTVTNTGPSDAVPVTVTDRLPAAAVFVSAQPSIGTCDGLATVAANANTLTCTAARLPASGTMTVLITVDVAASASGSLRNEAEVTSPVTGPGDRTTSLDSPVSTQAVLLVTKAADPEPVSAGSSATYRIVVTNQGPSIARDVTLTDSLPPGADVVSVTQDQGTCITDVKPLVCQLGDVSPSESIAVVAMVRIDPAAPAGTAVNSVEVTSPTAPAPATATATSTVVRVADLAIVKTSPVTHADAGTDVSYVLTVTQHGPSTVRDVVVTDPLPAGATVKSATPSAGTCVRAQTVRCDLGTLTPGAIVNIALIVTVAPDAQPGPLANTATVATTDAVTDPDPSNNTSTLTLPVDAVADLGVTKTVAPASLAPGEPLTYTITVTNAGPSTATGSMLDDALPLGLGPATVTPGAPGCAVGNTLFDLKDGVLLAPTSAQAVHCDFGDLAPGEQRVVTIAATVLPNAGAQVLANFAEVHSLVLDPHLADNEARADVALTPAARLSLSKSVASSPVTAGEDAIWLLTVTNAGPSDASDTVITDTLPAGTEFAGSGATPCEAVGLVLTCRIGNVAAGGEARISVTTRVGASIAGSLSNAATVTATGAGSGAAASATVEVVPPKPLPPNPGVLPNTGVPLASLLAWAGLAISLGAAAVQFSRRGLGH